MGLFRRNVQEQSADELQLKMAKSQEAIASQPGLMETMGLDLQEGVAYAELAQRLYAGGVEAPAVIHGIRATDQTDMSGGRKYEFDVSIRPASGELYQTQISQHMLPVQMEGLADGQAITVKYDPEAPQMALIHNW